MSTSPSRALLEPAAGASASDLVPFPYDSVPAESARGSAPGSAWPGRDPQAEEEARIAVREAQARSRGREEGLAESRKIFDEQLAGERSRLAEALVQFTRERAAYFEKIESEVVQLALSIARKILHRESQLDPLLLAGIVRVALEQIDGATEVTLRLHPQNAEDWRRYFSLQVDPPNRPVIVEDPSLSPDHCTLETAMGTAKVGIETQLKEIEQGMMDLLAARPGSGS